MALYVQRSACPMKELMEPRLMMAPPAVGWFGGRARQGRAGVYGWMDGWMGQAEPSLARSSSPAAIRLTWPRPRPVPVLGRLVARAHGLDGVLGREPVALDVGPEGRVPVGGGGGLGALEDEAAGVVSFVIWQGGEWAHEGLQAGGQAVQHNII